MKKIVLLFIAIIASFNSYAQTPPGATSFRNLKVTEITTGTKKDSLVVMGSDKILRYTPQSSLGGVFVPLSGTYTGKPIIGDLEMDIDKRIYNQLSGRIKQFKFADDGFIEMNVYDTLDTSSASNVRVGLQQVQLFSTNGTDSNLVYVFPDKTVFDKDIELSDGKKIFITDGSFKIGGVDYGIDFVSDNPVNSLIIQAPETSQGIVGNNVFTNDGSNPAQYVQNDALQAFGDSQTLNTILNNGSTASISTELNIQSDNGTNSKGSIVMNGTGVVLSGQAGGVFLNQTKELKGSGNLISFTDTPDSGDGTLNFKSNGGVSLILNKDSGSYAELTTPNGFRVNNNPVTLSVNGNTPDAITGAINITSGAGSGTVTNVTGVTGETTVANNDTTPVVGISAVYTTARNTYADSKVENNLTASTTIAPSKSAVNTALALKGTLASANIWGGLNTFNAGMAVESFVSTYGSTFGTVFMGSGPDPFFIRRNSGDPRAVLKLINMHTSSTGNSVEIDTNIGGVTATRVTIPKSGIATVTTDLTRKDYVDGLTGWASYTDTAYTSGAPFTINSGVTSTLPNNAGTVINNQLPAGVTSFYNSGTGKFTPITDGDYYIVTIRFKAQTTAPTAGYLDFGIDIGGAFGVQFKETKIFAKGANIEHNFSVTVPCYTGSTFVANGGLIKLTSGGGTMTVYDINFQFDRVHKSK